MRLLNTIRHANMCCFYIVSNLVFRRSRIIHVKRVLVISSDVISCARSAPRFILFPTFPAMAGAPQLLSSSGPRANYYIYHLIADFTGPQFISMIALSRDAHYNFIVLKKCIILFQFAPSVNYLPALLRFCCHQSQYVQLIGGTCRTRQFPLDMHTT